MKIGVLTSGGDAPGMNAVIRSVVRTAIYNNIEVIGIKKGYTGLLDGDFYKMSSADVSDILHRGGTMLQTARCKELMEKSGVEKGVSSVKAAGMDALVVIGGDGSFRGAKELSALGVNVICIPGTIDNDIACTDYCIGYDTAMNTALDAIDKIRDTASSHQRCSIIEVMGRKAGYIALPVGISCGAECVIAPEYECDFEEDIIKQIKIGQKRGKTHFLVIVAEGKVSAGDFAKRIEREAGIHARTTVLGYIQRGGSPTLCDRLVASHMGYHAVRTLLDGKRDRIIVMKNGKITDIDITDGLCETKSIDPDYIDISKILGTM